MEGLGVATSLFEPYIIPITIGILIALFYFQRLGTAGVGRVFGPVTLVGSSRSGCSAWFRSFKSPAFSRPSAPATLSGSSW